MGPVVGCWLGSKFRLCPRLGRPTRSLEESPGGYQHPSSLTLEHCAHAREMPSGHAEYRVLRSGRCIERHGRVKLAQIKRTRIRVGGPRVPASAARPPADGTLAALGSHRRMLLGLIAMSRELVLKKKDRLASQVSASILTVHKLLELEEKSRAESGTGA